MTAKLNFLPTHLRISEKDSYHLRESKLDLEQKRSVLTEEL